MTKYEIVRDCLYSDTTGASREPMVQRHPEQPENGFATASDAAMWCDTPTRQLGGEWYISPVKEDK